MDADQNCFSIGSGEERNTQYRGHGRHRNPDIEWISIAELAIATEAVEAMVGRSPQLRTVFAAIERLRPYRSPILVVGETGTGKELVARALHARGPYAKGPFVVFNCCNLVDTLAESQLFGHVKGAFTDASQESQGCFRAANGGTLMLDEVGDLPLTLQGKLLRAVETLEIQPVGSAQTYRVDLRLVAATNRDLGAMVKASQFRADLYYRLNTAAISFTPLRERSSDIEVLLAHFVMRYNRELGKRIEWISARALAALQQHAWPGNVRELAHLTENAVLMAPDEGIDLEDLTGIQPEVAPEPECAGTVDMCVEPEPSILRQNPRLEPSTLKSIVKDALLDALHKTGGNRRRAAQVLGVSRSTFYRMLANHGVSLSAFDLASSTHAHPWPPMTH
ncbi:MAG TPA: sigma-54 dependent transcriptional regulator [Candidatus Binataceae bacterium]|nr:sigma-54 dependent transcriptional regulator [Candidatus Binataceae bacterium]